MNQKGFSLLEPILVAAIISIISLYAFPSIISFSDELQIDYEANKLVSDLRYLQELSLSNQNNHNLFPSVSSETFPQIFFSNKKYYITHNKKTILTRNFPADMKISRNRSNLSFANNGNATNLTISMELRNSRRNIIVDVVGRIRVEEKN